MEKRIRTQQDKKEYIIIFLCWLVYASAYLGKYSFTSNTAVIGPYYGVDKADVGLVSTVFFIAYGIGQVVNGIFCKYYPKKIIITLSLLISSAINLVLFFDIPFGAIKYLWLINAVAQSILWPTLIQTIGAYVSKNKMEKAVLAMSTTIAVGTILSYALSAVFVQFSSFKMTFFVASVYLAAVAICWIVVFGITTKNMTPIQNQEKVQTLSENKMKSLGADEKKQIYRAFYVTLVCLIVFAIINNFVKDGLNTWVPNILKEMYHLPDSLSIILTITLSILGIFGAFTAAFLNRYVKDFVGMCGIFFALASVLVGGVLGLFHTQLWIAAVICFGVISLLMHAINNVITSMFALYMPDSSKAGLYSGLMNGACYVGSACSAYGLGMFADLRGWVDVFYLLLFACVVPIVIAAIYTVVKRIQKRKTNQ